MMCITCCAGYSTEPLFHVGPRIGFEAIEVSWDSLTSGGSRFPSCCACCGTPPKTRVSVSSPEPWKPTHTRLMPVIGKYLTMRHPNRGEYELVFSETQSSSASSDCHTHIYLIVSLTCPVRAYLCISVCVCVFCAYSYGEGGQAWV